MKDFKQVFNTNFDTDVGYLVGKARNEDIEGDGTGTPWHQIVINDLMMGPVSALFNHSDVVADNSDEKAGQSQWVDALKTLAKDMNWGDRFVGSFARGFTFIDSSSIARGQDGKYYNYVGNDPFPKVISAGVNPSGDVDFGAVVSGSASSISNSDGTTVQDYIDYNLKMEDVNELVNLTLDSSFIGSVIRTNAFNLANQAGYNATKYGPVGGADYRIMSKLDADAAGLTYWTSGAIEGHYSFLINSSYVAALTSRTTINPEQLGAVPDKYSTEAFKTLVSADVKDILPAKIIVPDGLYRLSETLNVKRVIHMDGQAGTQAGSRPSALSWDDNLNGIIIHRSDTMCDSAGLNKTYAPNTGAADGTVISRLALIRGDGRDIATDSRFKGVRFISRAIVRDCNVSGFQGAGIFSNATASTSTSGDTYGNANNWGLYDTRIQNCQHGVHMDNADVNAGVAVHVDASSNREVGIFDSSFLGCQWIGCHMNGNGSDGVAGFDYDILHDNQNARSLFIGCYIESGGKVKATAPAMRIGGIWSNISKEGSFLEINEDSSKLNMLISNVSARGATSGVGEYLEVWNVGSHNSSRGAAITFKAGVVNGANQPTGRIAGIGGASSLVSKSVLTFDIFDGTLGTPDYDTALIIAGSSNAIAPGTDNKWSAGTANNRYSEVFSVTGTINTSDEREKQDVVGLTEAELRVATKAKGLIKRFKWKAAVDSKGDDARYHFGVMAQELIQAFEDEGLNPYEYGVVCYDEWDEIPEETEEVLGDDGEPTGEVTVVQEYKPAGNRYGVRYEELLAFIIASI